MGEELQRARIVRALAEEMAVRADPHAVTVADVVARARISRRTFYELYADMEDLLEAAFELGLGLAGAEMYTAYTREARWQDGVRVALAELLGLLEREPALGRLCVVHALGGGPRVLARRLQAVELLCEYIDRGRLEGAGRIDPPEVAAEGLVGAVLAVLHTRLLGAGLGAGGGSGTGAGEGSTVGSGTGSGAQRPGSLIELLGPLMHLILLPYVGAAKAGRELTRPLPRAPIAVAAGYGQDPERDSLGVRLTYRTARVLRAIGERPGASNREVADQAGIVDQGQISRLLSRLESLGLVANTGAGTGGGGGTGGGTGGGGGSTRGTPNAWALTLRGEQVERATHLRATQRGPTRS
jgi:AcrR family transcriptional regulator